MAGTRAAGVVTVVGPAHARAALADAFLAELPHEGAVRRRFARFTSSLGLGPLADVVAEIEPSAPDLSSDEPWLRPAIDDLLGRSDEPRELGEIYAAVAQLLAGRTGEPMVVVVDDVHHAGHGWLNLVAYLVGRAGPNVLLVCAGDAGFASRAWPGQGAQTVVLEEGEVPPHLPDDPIERAVLETASVADTDVTDTLVARVAGLDDGTSGEVLAALAERGLLLAARGGSFSCPEPLARACYASMDAAARISMHGAVADALAGGFVGRTRPELVGAHYELAHRADEASLHYDRAGRFSLQRGDMPSAADLLARAARLRPRGDHVRLAATAASLDALLTIGRGDRAVAAARAAREEARAEGDHCMGARFGAWDALLAGTDPDALGPLLDSFGAALASCDDPLGAAQVTEARAHLLWDSGRVAESMDEMGSALAHARRASDRPTTARIVVWMLDRALDGPEPVPAAVARCDAFEWTRDWSALVEIRRRTVLAALSASRADEGGAREHLAAATRLEVRIGQPPWVARLPHVEAWIALLNDDGRRAEAVARPVFDELASAGHPGAVELGILLLRALVKQSRFEQAAGTASRALDISQTAWVDEDVRGELLAAHACALAHTPARPDIDVDAITRALPGAHLPLRRADGLVDTVATAARLGHIDRARELGSEAIDLYERKGAHACVARARKALAVFERQV